MVIKLGSSFNSGIYCLLPRLSSSLCSFYTSLNVVEQSHHHGQIIRVQSHLHLVHISFTSEHCLQKLDLLEVGLLECQHFHRILHSAPPFFSESSMMLFHASRRACAHSTLRFFLFLNIQCCISVSNSECAYSRSNHCSSKQSLKLSSKTFCATTTAQHPL